jgi:RNA polymerase sigma-70 factor (ECF subfamily)
MIMQEIIETLKPDEREIVILHVVGDLKHREIAAIVGKPLGTVTWIYNQAISKLKKEYRE